MYVCLCRYSFVFACMHVFARVCVYVCVYAWEGRTRLNKVQRRANPEVRFILLELGQIRVKPWIGREVQAYYNESMMAWAYYPMKVILCEFQMQTRHEGEIQVLWPYAYGMAYIYN